MPADLEQHGPVLNATRARQGRRGRHVFWLLIISTVLAAAALFGQGDLRDVDPDALRAAISGLPNTTAGASTSVVQLLVDTALTKSVGEARRAIAQGGVYVNNERIDDEAATLVGREVAGGMAVLRRGKRTLAGVFIPVFSGDTPGTHA